MFKILSLWADTLLPAVLPLLETFVWKSLLEWCSAYSLHSSYLRQWLQISSLSSLFLIRGTTNNRTEPCQGSICICNSILYVYKRMYCTYIHTQWKQLLPLCSWSGHGPVADDQELRSCCLCYIIYLEPSTLLTHRKSYHMEDLGVCARITQY